MQQGLCQIHAEPVYLNQVLNALIPETLKQEKCKRTACTMDETDHDVCSMVQVPAVSTTNQELKIVKYVAVNRKCNALWAKNIANRKQLIFEFFHL